MAIRLNISSEELARRMTRLPTIPGEKQTIRWTIKNHRVYLEYASAGIAETASNRTDRTLLDRPSAFLAGVVGLVRLTLHVLQPTKTTSSAEFTAEEIIAIFGDEKPNDSNIDNIRMSIAERKCYPMPGYEPPPERSREAQGQTKKPGSHSESRHNRR